MNQLVFFWVVGGFSKDRTVKKYRLARVIRETIRENSVLKGLRHPVHVPDEDGSMSGLVCSRYCLSLSLLLRFRVNNVPSDNSSESSVLICTN